jgi:hypothetical protein
VRVGRTPLNEYNNFSKNEKFLGLFKGLSIFFPFVHATCITCCSRLVTSTSKALNNIIKKKMLTKTTKKVCLDVGREKVVESK